MGFFCESWNRLSLFTRIMIGFAVGIILGLVMGPKAAIFAPLGTILFLHYWYVLLLTWGTEKDWAELESRQSLYFY